MIKECEEEIDDVTRKRCDDDTARLNGLVSFDYCSESEMCVRRRGGVEGGARASERQLFGLAAMTLSYFNSLFLSSF